MGLMDTQSPWLDDDQQDLWQALLTVVIALPAALDRQLQRDAGISNFEYGVLAQLSMADEATMRLSELARLCDSTQPRLSKVMDRFEARNWVARRTDPGDGRYTLATLTDTGRREARRERTGTRRAGETARVRSAQRRSAPPPQGRTDPHRRYRAPGNRRRLSGARRGRPPGPGPER